MQPVNEVQLKQHAEYIVNSFKRTCKSQSSTYGQCLLLPADKQFVRQIYTDPITSVSQEYILCLPELFTNQSEVKLDTLTAKQKRSFQVITDHIRTRVESDMEAQFLIKMCEPSYKDPRTSKIFRSYAYHYAQISGPKL